MRLKWSKHRTVNAHEYKGSFRKRLARLFLQGWPRWVGIPRSVWRCWLREARPAAPVQLGAFAGVTHPLWALPPKHRRRRARSCAARLRWFCRDPRGAGRSGGDPCRRRRPCPPAGTRSPACSAPAAAASCALSSAKGAARASPTRRAPGSRCGGRAAATASWRRARSATAAPAR